jgi:hypothetical protein
VLHGKTPVKPVPVRVTLTTVLPDTALTAEGGAIEVSSGPLIVNGRALLAVPPATTSMDLGPSVMLLHVGRPAVPHRELKVAVMLVELTTTTLLIVRPAAPPPPVATTLTVAPATKFVPVKVTLLDVPRNSKLSTTDVSVGGLAAEEITVNVTGPTAAPPTVTVTFLAVAEAPDEMVKVAVTVVALTGTKLLTAIPPPDTFTAVAAVRPVPVIVTFTTVPGAPVLGVIEARPPWAPVPWNSTAPTSKWFGFDGSGRGFP